MIKKLLTLPDYTLDKIATDINVTEGTRAQKAAAIKEYYYSYSLTWSDLASRYNFVA